MNEKTFKCHNHEKYIILEILVGELDLTISPRVLKEITNMLPDLGYPNMIIDLNNISYIDSTGLSILIALKNMTAKKNNEIILACSNDKILQVFEIANMDKFFNIYNDLKNAEKYVMKKCTQ